MVTYRGISGFLKVRFVREWRKCSGAELVEAALVIPMLLTLLLGIVWLGRAYNVYETITRAAREGARYAVLPTCATCDPANQMTETYGSAGTTNSPACVSNPTYEFTNYVAPSLAASHLDPNNTVVQQTFCQQAVVMNPTDDASSRQCGIEVSFKYPLQLAIPFTSLNASTIRIPTSVTMRMENQPVNGSTGRPACP